MSSKASPTVAPPPVSVTPPARRRRPRSLARRSSRAGLLYVAPAVILELSLFIIPVVMSLGMSFFDWPLFGQPVFIGLENFGRMLRDESFGQSLLFTTAYTVVATAVLFVIGFSLAALVRANRPGVGVFRTAYFIPVVIGMASASYLWVWMLNSKVGVIDSLIVDLGLAESSVEWLADPTWALFWIIVMVVWKMVGFTMLLLMVGMQSISEDYYDAAKIDGAGVWRRLFSITLPLLKRTIALVLILATIASYLAFDQFYILTSGGPHNSTITAVFWIYKMGFTRFELGYASALSLALMLILVVLSAIQLGLLRNDDG